MVLIGSLTSILLLSLPDLTEEKSIANVLIEYVADQNKIFSYYDSLKPVNGCI